MARRIVYEDHRQRSADRGIELEMKDGQVFHIEPPELWADAILKKAMAEDPFGVAEGIIGGPERYAEYVAAGGTASMIGKIVEEEFGATIPELAASSRS